MIVTDVKQFVLVIVMMTSLRTKRFPAYVKKSNWPFRAWDRILLSVLKNVNGYFRSENRFRERLLIMLN